ncbi:uncharacterized protein LOC118771481 [Megalops cyprinoides]|uniref:uncharacterized protein LOC118771481 n=1 Tax=Megalops cyprinoides TaxID=118141 RepID=UPI0018643193|nr:uncharacterized protein LOC118771481 [Megalops cyprinoides]
MEDHMELVGRSVWSHTVLLLITQEQLENGESKMNQLYDCQAFKGLKEKSGEDAVLPCYLQPNISAEDLEVRWFRGDFLAPVHLYVNRRDDYTNQIPSYRGRTALFPGELRKGNTSLRLLEVKASDDGSYKCFVKSKETDNYDDRVIRVTVKGAESPRRSNRDAQRPPGALCPDETHHCTRGRCQQLHLPSDPEAVPPGEGGTGTHSREGKLHEEIARTRGLRVVLLGKRWAGKSTAGNTILGRDEFGRNTEQCAVGHGRVAGRQVTVVDTPGWYEHTDTPENLSCQIRSCLSLCPPGPHAVLLVIPVWHSPVPEMEIAAAIKHLELLSQGVWRHTIVLFTRGDFLEGTDIKENIERRGEALRTLLERCGNRYHVLSSQDVGDGTQVRELLEKIEDVTYLRNEGHLQ